MNRVLIAAIATAVLFFAIYKLEPGNTGDGIIKQCLPGLDCKDGVPFRKFVG